MNRTIESDDGRTVIAESYAVPASSEERSRTVRIRRIVERATGLTDRLAGHVSPARDEPDAIGEERFRRWCDRVADGDRELFERRLGWDGLEPEAVKRALGSLRLSTDDQLPEWTDVLARTAGASRWKTVARRSSDVATEPIPFAEVLLPIVRVARRMLVERGVGGADLFRGSAWAGLEDALLVALSRISAHSLFVEFTSRRALLFGGSGLASVPVREGGRAQYERFVESVWGLGLLDFLERYPVLARLLCTRVLCWVDRTAELIVRLRVDRSELEERFGQGIRAGRVMQIRSDLSDPHNGWRTVCMLEFEGGMRVVYKPRSIEPEERFGELLGWLHRRGASPPLYVTAVVRKAGYGWMEFVEAEPCSDAKAVERYFERAGMLLCLVRVLGGGDFHHENVIARGEYPVLVDLEVIQGARLMAEREVAGESPSSVIELLWDSVCRTMLLPTEMIGPEGQAYQGGGLASGAPIPVRRLVFRNVNTDRMTLATEHQRVVPSGNLPRIGGHTVPASAHVEAIQHGFAEMYRLLRSQREEIPALRGPLGVSVGGSVRVIIRPTQVYAAALARSTHPRYLSSGVDMGIELDVLSRARLANNHERPLLWSAYRTELAALERMDIPLFSARCDDDRLRDPSGNSLGRYCTGSPSEETAARLHRLCDADLERQLRFISLSFRAIAVGESAHRIDHREGGLTREAAVAEARSIAAKLKELAYPTPQGNVWYGIIELRNPDRADLGDLGDGLYLGSTGVALLNAALFAVTEDPGYRKDSIRALERLLSGGGGVRGAVHRIARSDGYGLAGAGGVAYALALCGHLLRSTEITTAADIAASVLRPPHSRPDRMYHLVSGSAGAVLSLLAAHRMLGGSGLVRQAEAWAAIIAGGRTHEATTGLRAWCDPTQAFQSGLGKGVAGISHALLELHRETGRADQLDAALEGWEFVHSMREPDGTGWRISSQTAGNDDRSPAIRRAWCLGSSGIGLASAASIGTVAALSSNVETAIRARRSLGETDAVDNGCCGRAGHIDLLIMAADALARPALREEAAAVASTMVRRAARRGSYATGYGNVHAPGFFKGLAGIGYGLLRLHHAETLPSVLLLQAPRAA
jgi:type 2 lantibiotic biosynthesis protein LanM